MEKDYIIYIRAKEPEPILMLFDDIANSMEEIQNIEISMNEPALNLIERSSNRIKVYDETRNKILND